uniref:BTB domain-containing protein n=1 Tax=Caenorhabditis tropicalis TaxID=1561998 RepID=A0A1I7U2G3_9PELO
MFKDFLRWNALSGVGCAWRSMLYHKTVPDGTQKDGPIFEMADKCDSCECRDSMCIESPFDWNAQTEEEFQAHVLKEFNGARSRFSLKAEVTSMSKLVWDDELTQSLNETGCPENGTIEFPHVGGDLFLGMAGGLAELGDMFGETSVEESSNEVYQWTSLYTILWPQMTKVGCIRPPDCSTSVLCQFGDIKGSRAPNVLKDVKTDSVPETLSLKTKNFYEFGRTEFKFVLNDLENLDTVGKNSELYGTGDIDWHLNVCLNETPKGKYLSTFLFCTPVDVANAWETFGQFRIVLENPERPKQSVARQMDFSFESEEAENRGWNTFTSLDEVLEKDSGFVVNGGITFRVIVGVKKVIGFETAKYFNFLEKGEYSDGTISVDGTVFHVNKMIVSVHSPVISVEFAKTDKIEFHNLDSLEFNDFLQFLYAVPIRIEKCNVDWILRLSTRFDTYGLKLSCEQYLKYALKTGQIDTDFVIRIADEHKLKTLLTNALDSAKSADELKEKFKRYENLSIETRKQLAQKLLSFA